MIHIQLFAYAHSDTLCLDIVLAFVHYLYTLTCSCSDMPSNLKTKAKTNINSLLLSLTSTIGDVVHLAILLFVKQISFDDSTPWLISINTNTVVPLCVLC